jgi:hypothetical protein
LNTHVKEPPPIYVAGDIVAYYDILSTDIFNLEIGLPQRTGTDRRGFNSELPGKVLGATTDDHARLGFSLFNFLVSAGAALIQKTSENAV